MKQIFPVFGLLVLFGINTFSQSKPKTITIKSSDGIIITGDLYKVSKNDAPYIILYHQASYSRGEYREIAPKLNTMGFNCLAVDQRSGNAVNGITNETYQRAIKNDLTTKYPDAWPDLEATLLYVKHDLKARKIIIWGSSYSAALVFVLAAKHPYYVNGILAFSPGEYFKLEDKTISEFAKKVTCPVFITSARKEEDYWKPIYQNLSSTEKVYFLPSGEGFHGSKALWEENEGYEFYWKAVEDFLIQLK